MFCNLAMITAMVIVGLAANSLAVLATGVDYLADTAGVGVALLAIWLARRRRDAARPRGYHSPTSIAALVNASWPFTLNIAIGVAAIQRLIAGTRHVDGFAVLICSGVGACVMFAAALVLARDRGDVHRGPSGAVDRSPGGVVDRGGEAVARGPGGEAVAPGPGDDTGEVLNVKAVLLDTAADAATAAGVAVSGAIILAAGGWYWLDPAVALLIAVVVAYHAQKLLRKIVTAMRPSTAAGGRSRPRVS